MNKKTVAAAVLFATSLVATGCSNANSQPQFTRAQQLTSYLESQGVCRAKGPATTTLYSYETQYCVEPLWKHREYTVAIYGNQGQEDLARNYLPNDAAPGYTFVFGKGWSIMIPRGISPSTITKVMDEETDVVRSEWN